MVDTVYSIYKNSKLIPDPEKFVSNEVNDFSIKLEKSLNSIFTKEEMYFNFYICNKFNKIGNKSELAAFANKYILENDLGISVLINPNMVKKAKLEETRFLDASIKIISKYLVNKFKDDYNYIFEGIREDMQWVAYAVILGSSIPEFRTMTYKAPGQKTETPFNDRYISMGINEVSKGVASSIKTWKSSEEIKKLIEIREKAENDEVLFNDFKDLYEYLKNI